MADLVYACVECDECVTSRILGRLQVHRINFDLFPFLILQNHEVLSKSLFIEINPNFVSQPHWQKVR